MNLKETQNELISVIIPSYNSGKFLGEAIESVVNQTYKNIEIIVINDGSTDNTEEIAKKWQKRDERVRYLKHKENKGLSAARNTGIRTSKGDVIAFLDADDIWLENKLEKQMDKIEKGADLVYSDAILISEIGKKLGKNHWERIKIRPYSGKSCLKLLFQRDFISPASSVILKKKIFEKIGGFDEKLKYVEDYDFYLRALKEAITIDYIKAPLLFYRLGSEQMSKKEIEMERGRIKVLHKFIFSYPLFVLKHPCLVIQRLGKRWLALFAKFFGLYHEK